MKYTDLEIYTDNLEDAIAKSNIPEYMHIGVKLYVLDGTPPGSFLSAVLRNDLRQAVLRADTNNIHHLPDYIHLFYNHLPADCWGNDENVDNWLYQGITDFD